MLRSILTALILLGGGRGSAEEPLDIDRFVGIVLRTHPAARQADGLKQTGQAERKAARLFPDPTFELTLGRGNAHGTGEKGAENGFALSQRLPFPGVYLAGITAADREAEALGASAEATRWELELAARLTFFRALAAEELVEVVRGQEEDARSLRNLVKRRVELGESRESDRLKTEVEWLNQALAIRAGEREERTAQSVLRTLALEPLPARLVLRGELPGPVPPLRRDALVARLLSGNPQLRALRAEAERSRALAAQARRGVFPDLDLSLFRTQEIDKDSKGIGLSVRVPLWNANRGEVARSRAGAEVASAAADRTRIDLVARLEESVRAVETASDHVRSLAAEILPAAEESLRLSRLLYEEGETSLLDLLDAQRTFRETQREAIQARLHLALAASDLQQLVGPDFDPWR
jgi:cobalt-zinc-cadmium efflux system outer membrane protein